jgi:anti-sigma-K factor RskA
MNLSDLQTKLIESARRIEPSSHVPYAFEKRVMHQLGARRPETVLGWWGDSLWRGAAACIAVTLVCAVWASRTPQPKPEPAADLSQELQSTVFASMNQPTEDAW